MLKDSTLFSNGFYITHFSLPEELKHWVHQEDWEKIDQTFKKLTQKEGELYRFLQTFHSFQEIEFIISVRDAENEWEEDGIWHDDGSRVFAFSLSLTEFPEKISGGKLGIRRKGSSSFQEIPTPPFGDIILFLTGTYDYEHKIHKVSKGRRVIIAGWCS